MDRGDPMLCESRSLNINGRHIGSLSVGDNADACFAGPRQAGGKTDIDLIQALIEPFRRVNIWQLARGRPLANEHGPLFGYML